MVVRFGFQATHKQHKDADFLTTDLQRDIKRIHFVKNVLLEDNLKVNETKTDNN